MTNFPDNSLFYISITVLYLAAIWGGSLFVSVVLKPFKSAEITQGFTNAGKWIGYFERALMISFLLTDTIALMGFILTVKAIYRFGDIQGTNEEKMKLSEYFIIGTMASVFFTIILFQIFNYFIL